MKEFLSPLTRREFFRRFPGVLLVDGESKDVEQDGRLDEHEKRLKALEDTQERIKNALNLNTDLDQWGYEDLKIQIDGLQTSVDDLYCDVHPGGGLCPEENVLPEE